MTQLRVWTLTLAALLAFAGNSLLCRLALKDTAIDPATFTALRMLSGALVLWLIVQVRGASATGAGNWWSALALAAYAICFSFAYISLPVGSGALLLFGAVQATMIGYGLFKGERLRGPQVFGFAVAVAGLVYLLLPGLTAPPILGATLMLLAGVFWGLYSLRGRAGGDPTRTTAGNFLRATPLAVLPCIATLPQLSIDLAGIAYALASGAVASGLGYAIWYTALKGLRATEASAVQLAVPVITALGGIVLLSEPLVLRLAIASAAILGGLALVLFTKAEAPG